MNIFWKNLSDKLLQFFLQLTPSGWFAKSRYRQLFVVTPDISFVNLANCCSKQYFAITYSGLFFWKIVVPGKLFANRGSSQRLCKFCNLLLAIFFFANFAHFCSRSGWSDGCLGWSKCSFWKMSGNRVDGGWGQWGHCLEGQVPLHAREVKKMMCYA